MSLRTAEDIELKSLLSCQHAALALMDARDYDIVHNHAGEEVMALSHLVPGVPMLTTMHCLITPDTKLVWDIYRGYFNNISWAQRRLMPQVRRATFAGVAYNGIDVSSFPFQREKEDYLLFISRISPEKGPEQAIEVARRTGRRLVMAGKVDPKDREYYASVVAPLIDGRQIVFRGEADGTLKRELYRHAYCLLMPIDWEEPFGLVMPEAMACGTPVIVFNRGAAAEIVEHGETGFVVETLEEMARAVGQVNAIDPAYCRARMERRFDAPVMASRYLDLYESILETGGTTKAAVASSGVPEHAGELSPTRVA